MNLHGAKSWTFRHQRLAGLLDHQRTPPVSGRGITRYHWRRPADCDADAKAIARTLVAATGSVVWSVDFNQTVAPIGTLVKNTDLVGRGVSIDEELVGQHLDLEDGLFF